MMLRVVFNLPLFPYFNLARSSRFALPSAWSSSFSPAAVLSSSSPPPPQHAKVVVELCTLISTATAAAFFSLSLSFFHGDQLLPASTMEIAPLPP